MVNKRKKLALDATDRAILKNMLDVKRNLTGNQIAKKVNLSASAISPRLNNLKNQGIIKQSKVFGLRSFKRTFGKGKTKIEKRIKAPRSIFWDIDFKKKR